MSNDDDEQWMVCDDGIGVHICRTDDWITHNTLSLECVCGPQIVYQDQSGSFTNGPLVIHKNIENPKGEVDFPTMKAENKRFWKVVFGMLKAT
jgi:hypothetical protein